MLKSSDIPLISDVNINAAPFSDVSFAGGVDNPEHMLAGWTGWATRGRRLQPEVTEGDVTYEATVGRYLTSPAALLQVLSDRRRAVAMITASGHNFEGTEGLWRGTGFIVGSNLFLTNHHVLNSAEVARGARIEFDYEISPENLLLGDGRPPPAPQVFRLDPGRLFLTSPTEGGLDYTFVWIEDAAAQQFGKIPMERASFTVAKLDQAFVVHHPDGQPKQVSLDDTDIIGMDTTVVHYSSDTLEGSSGAPVCDRRGRLIALHHASRAQTITLPDGAQVHRVNEGIKISAIAIDIEARVRKGGGDASHAETVLREIKGSDTMSGFFGGYGRRIDPSKTGPEAVVDTYRGTDQDIDLAFWNVEWLATRYGEPGKLEGAAKVIADLNVDAWGLAEVSPRAVEALVTKIFEIYGERYEFAFSEPHAAAGKQSTAMIWKSSSLTGQRVEWPSRVEPLFRQRSDDGELQVEAVHGRIFDRYPGLFQFSTTGKLPAYRFFAVPLHLKAMDEGSLRRRLAARILAKAIEDLTADSLVDVVVGGDMNAPLAGGDFTAIEDAGFMILGAKDENEGAFSYIKSPRSAIDNIFLSPSMRQTVGKIDYFIVAKDRTMPNYLDVSDHRPVAVRLSLLPGGDVEREIGGGDLDTMIAQLLAVQQNSKPAAKRGRAAPSPRLKRGSKRGKG